MLLLLVYPAPMLQSCHYFMMADGMLYCIGRLSTTADAIEKGINALAEVLLECGKKNLSIADFELSVTDLRFNDEAKTFLSEVFIHSFITVLH